MPRYTPADTLKPATFAILTFLARTYESGAYTPQAAIERHVMEDKGLPVMESLEEVIAHKWVETHPEITKTMRITDDGLAQYDRMAEEAAAKEAIVAAKPQSGGVEVEGPTEIPRAPRGAVKARTAGRGQSKRGLA